MKTTHYPQVAQQADFAQLERGILAFWAQDKTFEASVAQRPPGSAGGKEYVFYDGPPFANGLPHYGHLLTGFVKDIVPRFQTMRGFRVERRFGWDCHGLPAEMEAEKTLGISGRARIQEYGIERFNASCRETVLRYTAEWRAYVSRQARWVDFDNDYKTLDLPYMESVMWAFKQLWDKGLVYEGRRVVPYSWAAETPLSNFETRLDNSYRPRQDPAITVRFPLVEPLGGAPAALLIWTTTPWTLPSNLAAAVGSDIQYEILEKDGDRVVLSTDALERYARELEGYQRVGGVGGAELVGKLYTPPFEYFAKHPNSFRILAGDFVTTEDGTGIVHLAPGFGEDDQRVGELNGIELVSPVDDSGRFTPEVPDWVGVNVFDANKPIIRRLHEKGLLFKQATYEHNYPHCWRTDTPIIYRAIPSWYVRVSAFKERMSELNQSVNWIPEHIRDGQFGKWLSNARDWSISRNRFWASPIPVWKSDDPRYPRIDAYGSLDELERDFGVRPTDLHRPFIDDLVRPNPDDPTGQSKMRRVPEVLDCWFESGAMPFSQVHYPFEKKAWFERHFPANFVVEYVGQTRGWFYTMMALSSALFDSPPFRNVMCHGVVLDLNGQKLSKKLRNYADPMALCETYGADALRWSLVSTGILRGSDLQLDAEGKAVAETARLVLNPIWNAYYFFTLYANSDGIKASSRYDSPNLLDRYILAKLGELVRGVTQALDAYDIAGGCEKIVVFLDVMNNWYIRRSRPRFWGNGESVDTQSAYDTLYTVLITLCQVAAPLLPLLTEEIFRNLTGERSVHLSDWPDANLFPELGELRAMDRVREVCSAALSLREAKRLRVRLPLKSLTVAGDTTGLAAFSQIIKDEVNVKEVTLSPDVATFASYQLKLKANVLGARLGPAFKAVLAASKSGNWERLPGGRLRVGPAELSMADADLTLSLKPGVVGVGLPGSDVVVILDTDVTEELANEGLARDLVRLIQQARKKSELHVSDRISLSISLPDKLRRAVAVHSAYIAAQTLALELSLSDSAASSSIGSEAWVEHATLEGQDVQIGIRRSATAATSA